MWEEEYPELDPAFVERDHRRKEGLPVLIAKTARLVIRETVMEDVPRIFEIYNCPAIEDPGGRDRVHVGIHFACVRVL